MSKHTTLETTMPGPSSTIIDHLLGELWERGGSDLLLTARSAPFLRVDGSLRPVEGPALTEPEADRLVTGVLGTELTERFRREKQVDFAFSWGRRPGCAETPSCSAARRRWRCGSSRSTYRRPSSSGSPGRHRVGRHAARVRAGHRADRVG
ncbi:hypothetical protein ACU4GG_34715 [Streptomyces nojiriensis]